MRIFQDAMRKKRVRGGCRKLIREELQRLEFALGLNKI
jgi:hypothetical protein